MLKISKFLSLLGITAVTVSHTAQGAHPTLPTPDTPASFGYKMSWFAVKTSDPQSVVATLGAKDSTPANWSTGIAAAYDSAGAPAATPLVYVTAPVDGWVFVVGAQLPLPDQRAASAAAERTDAQRFDVIFSALYRRFPDVQFFTTHRVIGLDGWARARAGRVERVFRMDLESAQVYANYGHQSAAERQLKMLDISGLSTTAARDAIFAAAEQRQATLDQLVAQGRSRKEAQSDVSREHRDPIPDEQDTMAVAAAWSVDPSVLDERKLPPSTGFIAHLP